MYLCQYITVKVWTWSFSLNRDSSLALLIYHYYTEWLILFREFRPLDQIITECIWPWSDTYYISYKLQTRSYSKSQYNIRDISSLIFNNQILIHQSISGRESRWLSQYRPKIYLKIYYISYIHDNQTQPLTRAQLTLPVVGSRLDSKTRLGQKNRVFPRQIFSFWNISYFGCKWLKLKLSFWWAVFVFIAHTSGSPISIPPTHSVSPQVMNWLIIEIFSVNGIWPNWESHDGPFDY